MPNEFKKWRSELIATGQIVQDDDEGPSEEEGVSRFDRYVELIDAVTGAEGQEVFQAIIDSIHAIDDYGAYEGTYNALWCFPPAQAGVWMAEAFPALFRRVKSKSFQAQRMILPVLDAGEEQAAFLAAAKQWSAANRRTALAAFRSWVAEDADFEKMLALLGGHVKKPDLPEDAPAYWPDDWRKFLAKVRSGKKTLREAWGDGSKPAKRLDLVIALLGINHGDQWRDADTLTNPLFFYAKRVYPEFIAKLLALPAVQRSKVLASIRRASPRKIKTIETDVQTNLKEAKITAVRVPAPNWADAFHVSTHDAAARAAWLQVQARWDEVGPVLHHRIEQFFNDPELAFPVAAKLFPEHERLTGEYFLESGWCVSRTRDGRPYYYCAVLFCCLEKAWMPGQVDVSYLGLEAGIYLWTDTGEMNLEDEGEGFNTSAM